MKKKILPFMLCILFVSICTEVSAQEEININSVILCTDINYPDALVAATVANKIGAPVLLTDKNSIPDETMNNIENFNVETVYIIGGPAVVSERVENELKDMGYEVIRIWGMTRYGTSARVAEYFWADGSDKAVLVWDKVGNPEGGNDELVVTAKDLAQSNDIPLLITSTGKLSSVVSDALSNLRVKEIFLVGNFNENLLSELDGMGIAVSEEFRGNSSRIRKKITERIQNKAMAEGNRTRLVVVAVGNWRDAVGAPFHPGRSITRLIKNESEIPNLIEEINSNSYEDIKVVGKPELADRICDSLSSADIDAECITGNASKIAARIAEREIKRIQKLRERFMNRMNRIIEKLREIADDINQSCSEYFELANSTIVRLEDNISDIQEYKETIRKLYQDRRECVKAIKKGNYSNARNLAQKIKSGTELVRWKLRNLTPGEIQQMIDSEIQNKSEFRNSIKEEVKAITSEIKEIVKEFKTTDAELCLEQMGILERLENAGNISQVQNRISTVKMYCEKAKKEVRKSPKIDRPVATVPTSVTTISKKKEIPMTINVTQTSIEMPTQGNKHETGDVKGGMR